MPQRRLELNPDLPPPEVSHQAIHNQTSFHWGTVAFCDILGFRGMWSAVQPSKILAELKFLAMELRWEAAEENRRRKALEFKDTPALKISSFVVSDNIALFAGVNPEWRKRVGNLGEPGVDDRFYNILAGYSTGILVTALMNVLARHHNRDELLFNFRGHITTGFYIAESGMWLGPAVDLAAAGMEKPDGAWITMSRDAALDYRWNLNRWLAYDEDESDATNSAIQKHILLHAVRHGVPLPVSPRHSSLGHTQTLSVLNPLCRASSLDEANELIQKSLRLMEAGPGRNGAAIQRKRENTSMFYDGCLSAVKKSLLELPSSA